MGLLKVLLKAILIPIVILVILIAITVLVIRRRRGRKQKEEQAQHAFQPPPIVQWVPHHDVVQQPAPTAYPSKTPGQMEQGLTHS
ncbi:hypothetical protein NUU61_004231 [Penicillium alfredii]|uniref:Uncharacterized protein n=1 Tax=Penicillium alfredii TaxID=1506179 RepID=A0A9W9FKQ5_9EURO|nr:uncharacterized protein NUU61_004231 [Penicillium alfredii]KAJ5102009.1 hypothetical protein NUU61_004231 [Penicillium alfredii]